MQSRMLLFLATILFVVSLGVLLFELTLTRIFSIILWYDYSFMAISIAFFGLGIGSLLVHVQRDKIKGTEEETQRILITRILQSAIAFAISLPAFLFVIGFIPPDSSYIYIYYLVSSFPFFFAGTSVALIFFAFPKEINKLYFADLIGAASATLILDPLMQALGAESVMLLTALLVIGASVVAGLSLRKALPIRIVDKVKVQAVIAVSIGLLLLTNSFFPAILAVKPGITKGLHSTLTDPAVDLVSTRWNSFSRVDVTKPNYDVLHSPQGPVELGSIVIDADAVTPVLRWNGSGGDTTWIRNYMDYLPFRLLKANHTLVIGGGGGEDILVSLAGGAKDVTTVELNPLVIDGARQFGNLSGNLYNRNNVKLFVDDGRRFISSTESKYDVVTIKLVDSWAAQLAGGYALTENYLYTVEAFRGYLNHLNDNGIFVMVRWNWELPRLMPLVVESLKQAGKTDDEIAKQIIVVQDRPGLYFGENAVLVLVKNTPFTQSQVNLAKDVAENNGAEIIALSDLYIEPPYNQLLPGAQNNGYIPRLRVSNEASMPLASLSMKPPTDDSPFYFAKEPIPKQMVTLIMTVLAISVGLSVLLTAYTRRNQIQLSSTSRFYIAFAAFIGLGFMFLEVTFIQKFLLLLGTPIMALTVILFSILLSTGVGSYLSGKIFSHRPHRAVLLSIPILAGIILLYYGFLGDIIDYAMSMNTYQRIALTFGLLSPAGILMGFQFPSIIKMANIRFVEGKNDTTLLWGVNIIASVTGTVFSATLAMVIGFSGNLLLGLAFYACAFLSVILAIISITKPNRAMKIF